MKNSFRLFMLAALITAGIHMTPVLAETSTSTSPANCNPQTYSQSIDVSAKPTFRWQWFGVVHMVIPWNSVWKVSNQKLTKFEKDTKSGDGAVRYSFGRAFANPLSECEYEREYTLHVKQGNVYKPEYAPYEARVEKIGANTVTIYQPTGNTDCPGEHAILLKKGKVIEFAKTCSALDAESRKIIASIN